MVSRRFGIGLAAACLVASTAAIAPAAIIIEHAGSSAPTAEGWAHQGTGYGQAVTDGPTLAWEISSYGAYVYNYTAGANTWKLSATLRVLGTNDVVDTAISAMYNTGGGKSFAMYFGSDAGGNPRVNLGSNTYTISGTGYHTYELRSTLSGADLYVDNNLIQSGYAGATATPGTGFARWGSTSTTATGDGYYSDVQLVSPVPEPAAMGLLGLLGTLALRRRRSE